MRDVIFINHATSKEDDEFTKWLALKLIDLGYNVWCDILFLNKGVDFWKDIEAVIRNKTIRFLAVASRNANNREGVLREITVANKVKKEINDELFILPLMIDRGLSNSDLNIELVRLNTITFYSSWAAGLREVVTAFEKSNIPKASPNPDKARQIYEQIFLQNRIPIHKEEIFESNWFSITKFPEKFYLYSVERSDASDIDVSQITVPCVVHKNSICTFEQNLKSEYQIKKQPIAIPTESILSNQYSSPFISNGECRRIIVEIINKAFDLMIRSKGLNAYEMSNKIGYWFTKNQVEKDKINGVLMVGKQKDKNWHFGISAAGKLSPIPVLMVSSHIYFTLDGSMLIASTSIQHKSRRRQGKSWWNETWKSKLLSFVDFLADKNDSINLVVGMNQQVEISKAPLQFVSQMSYLTPEKNVVQDEIDEGSLNEFNYPDEIESDEASSSDEIENQEL